MPLFGVFSSLTLHEASDDLHRDQAGNQESNHHPIHQIKLKTINL